jgi:hypothetical protein
LNLGANFSVTSCFGHGNDAEVLPLGIMFGDSWVVECKFEKAVTPPESMMLLCFLESSPETKDPLLVENKEGSHDHMEDKLVETED